jgi:hypothetical protein
MGTLKLPKGVIRQLDKFRKHSLWRGADLNSKKPCKVAWPLVCLPKKEGGLGVVNLFTHNEAMLLKFLHKFFSRADIPWVQLVWESYYRNGKLPGQGRKGSFWWRDIVNIMDKFKNLSSVAIGDGSTVLFWKDKWGDLIPAQAFPELFSFAKKPDISFLAATSTLDFTANFNLPLSVQAHDQLLLLQSKMDSLHLSSDADSWLFTWGSAIFSTSKAYKALIGHREVHPIYNWLWKAKCQMKHKVFFWLLIKDRLSTRDLLSRKNMNLSDVICDLCILQKRESMPHLFLRCNFAKACWQMIGAMVPTARPVLHIFNNIRRKLQVSFFMEIIILMSWSIWTVRNDWIFNNLDPSIQRCKDKFVHEFKLLLHRVRPDKAALMNVWLQSF